LNGRDITIYRNDLDGTFYLSSDGEGVYFNSMPPDSGGPDPVGEFAVYPSPATSQASFAWSTAAGESCFISVFNLNGEKVLDVQAFGGVYTWDLSTGAGVVSPGLYAVLFRTSGGEAFSEYFAISR